MLWHPIILAFSLLFAVHQGMPPPRPLRPPTHLTTSGARIPPRTHHNHQPTLYRLLQHRRAPRTVSAFCSLSPATPLIRHSPAVYWPQDANTEIKFRTRASYGAWPALARWFLLTPSRYRRCGERHLFFARKQYQDGILLEPPRLPHRPHILQRQRSVRSGSGLLPPKLRWASCWCAPPPSVQPHR